MTDNTENKKPGQEEPRAIPERSCGKVLAEARKEQGKTIEDISKSLNLSVGQVRSIELDQSEGLPETTYIRGYIRSYAKLLGLDSVEVLSIYSQITGDSNQSSFTNMPTELSARDTGTSSKPFSAYHILVLLVVAASLGFLMYTGLIPSPFKNNAEVSSTNTALTSSSQPNDKALDSAEESSSIEEEQFSVSAESSSLDTDESAEQAESDSQADAGDEAVQAASGNAVASTSTSIQLQLQFKQASWLDVRDENNEKLAYQSYDGGESITLESDGKLHVFIGNADGVDVELNGESYDIEPHREGVYAKFSIE